MNTHTKKTNENGFTLIEMAIVVMIIGIALASVAQLYSQRIKYLQADDARTDIELVTRAMAGFLENNGRYPCPASLTAIPGADPAAGQPVYGRETDCADGVINTILANGVVTTPENVRIGALPFKELNIEENLSVDGYRNRYIYAVTESQAVPGGFAPDAGNITLIDEDDAITSDNLHFVLYSMGENGVGAYTREGALSSPCDAVSSEGENCDFADSTFRAAQRSTRRNNTEFDDVIVFNALGDMPKWQSSDDHISLIGDDLGIGPGVNRAPTDELDVMGVIRAQDNPLTTDVKEGKVKTSNLCMSSDASNCFPSALIGKEDEPHPDMTCPTGQFMKGIAHGKAECTSEITIKCPDGEVATGISASGNLICSRPKNRCEDLSVPVCRGEGNKTLLAADHATERVVTGGLSKRKRYKCNDGVWQFKAQSGLCTCDAGALYSYERNCRLGSSCGDRYSGTFTRTVNRQCPSGRITRTDDRSTCTCENTVRTQTPSCGEGFNGGTRKVEFRHDCDTKRCSAPIEVLNTCSCSETTREEWKSCPSGFNGTYKVFKNFNCPDGSDQPGFEDPEWQEVAGLGIAERCSCQESSFRRREVCPPGQEGDLETLIEYKCTNGANEPPERFETEIENVACTPIPEPVCTWTWLEGSRTDYSDQAHRTRAGRNECACGTPLSETVTCSTGSGPFEIGKCQCEVSS